MSGFFTERCRLTAGFVAHPSSRFNAKETRLHCLQKLQRGCLPSAEDDPVTQRLGDEPCEDDDGEQEAGEAKADAVGPATAVAVEEDAGDDAQQQRAAGHGK